MEYNRKINRPHCKCYRGYVGPFCTINQTLVDENWFFYCLVVCWGSVFMMCGVRGGFCINVARKQAAHDAEHGHSHDDGGHGHGHGGDEYEGGDGSHAKQTAAEKQLARAEKVKLAKQKLDSRMLDKEPKKSSKKKAKQQRMMQEQMVVKLKLAQYSKSTRKGKKYEEFAGQISEGVTERKNRAKGQSAHSQPRSGCAALPKLLLLLLLLRVYQSRLIADALRAQRHRAFRRRRSTGTRCRSCTRGTRATSARCCARRSCARARWATCSTRQRWWTRTRWAANRCRPPRWRRWRRSPIRTFTRATRTWTKKASAPGMARFRNELIGRLLSIQTSLIHDATPSFPSVRCSSPSSSSSRSSYSAVSCSTCAGVARVLPVGNRRVRRWMCLSSKGSSSLK